MNNNTYDEAWLHQEIANNEKKIMAYLVKYAYQRKISNPVDTAEDVLQDAKIRAIKGLHTYNPNYSFSQWFFSISINVMRDHIKKSWKNGYGSNAVEYEKIDNYINVIDGSHGYVDENNIIDGINNRMTLESALRILEEMPNTLSVPLYKIEFLGESYEDVAEELGLKIPALRVRLHRAKKMARARAGSMLLL